MSEKILSQRSGTDSYSGAIVEAEVDYVMVNDVTGPIAFRQFEKLGRPAMKDKIVLIPDHYVPNKDVASAEQAKLMRDFARRHGIDNYYEVGRSGVCHQLMIDEGFVAPGRLIVGADSHSCTYGGLNAFSTGIGSTEAAAVFVTGRLWFKIPKTIKVELEGSFRNSVCGKDLAIKLLTDLGSDRANYETIEFSGPGVSSVPVSDRLTISNMSTEAGAKAGMFPCDSLTEDHIRGTVRGRYGPVESDEGAEYASVMHYDLSEIEPMVSYPYLPRNGHLVKDTDVKIDQAYLGSCTNGRIEDMRAAANVLRGRKVNKGVRMIVVPASQSVFRSMLREGLMEIFAEAGAFVSGPTCGACLGGYMGVLGDGEVAVSSTNRNFIGRMGHERSKVYLASPAVVAASAVAGRIVSPEDLP